MEMQNILSKYLNKKTGPILPIKSAVSCNNMSQVEGAAESSAIDQYKKKVDDLSMNNRALSQALETSHRTIYHQNKVITNLEKKLVSDVPEVLMAKFQAIGTALKHVVDLVEEVSVLLKSNAASKLIHNDIANSHSISREDRYKSNKSHHKRSKHSIKKKKSPPKVIIEQTLSSDSESESSLSESDSDSPVGGFSQTKIGNTSLKRKKCKKSSSKRDHPNIEVYNSKSEPKVKKLLLKLPGNLSMQRSSLESNRRALNSVCPSTSNSENKSKSKKKSVDTNASNNLNSSNKTASNNLNSSNNNANLRNVLSLFENLGQRITRKNEINGNRSDSEASAHNTVPQSNKTTNVTNKSISKPNSHKKKVFSCSTAPTRVSTRRLPRVSNYLSDNSNTDASTNINTRLSRRKQNSKHNEVDNMSVISDNGDNNKCNDDHFSSTGFQIKSEPEDVIGNVHISSVQSNLDFLMNSNISQPRVVLCDIFRNAGSECDPVIMRNKLEYLAKLKSSNEMNNEVSNCSINVTSSQTEVTSMETPSTVESLENNDIVLNDEGNLHDITLPEKNVLEKNQVLISMFSPEKVSRSNDASPFVNPIKENTAEEKPENKKALSTNLREVIRKDSKKDYPSMEFSDCSNEEINWKEVFEAILKS